MVDLQIKASLDTLCSKATQFIDQGRFEAARPLLTAARALGQLSPEIALLYARLHIQINALGQAASDLDAAIGLAPMDAALLRCRATLRQRNGDLEGAARDAAEAVILDPKDPESKFVLGQAMMGLGRVSDSVGCLANALDGSPRDPRYREALAGALESEGDPDAALRILDDGISLCPGHITMRNAAILLCLRQRNFDKAARIAEQARVAGIADASTFGMAGHALAILGEHENAAVAFREALKLCPEDQSLGHLASAAANNTKLVRAPEAYLRTIFDGYADRFERHILSLHYKVPILIRALLRAHPKMAAGQPLGPALDLGCGTGLIALALEDLRIGPFTGIDLAPRMLAHARAKGLYAELRQNDIIADLSTEVRRWPLIVAADVVGYFGALEELLSVAYQRLEDGGWFIFSVEQLVSNFDSGYGDNACWSPVRHGRYAHTEHYIYEAACAAGFRILHTDRTSIRQEAGEDVLGLLIATQRACHHPRGVVL
jgi:predicted TPR repeat methyltransferase